MSRRRRGRRSSSRASSSPEEPGSPSRLRGPTSCSSRRQSGTAATGVASRWLQAGIDYCSDQGLERDRLYLLAWRARLELDQGRWGTASESAAAVLGMPRSSITPRIVALVVLGLVRARRGDPGQWAPLEEAWALAEPTGELPRLAPVAAARAEAAWLEGDRHAVAEATEDTLRLAVERTVGVAGRRACRLAPARRFRR